MVKPVKQASSGQAPLRNLSELEEPPEAPEDKWVLTYINKLTTYVFDLAATFLGFARDAEASALVLGLDRLHIQTEASHERLVQDEGM